MELTPGTPKEAGMSAQKIQRVRELTAGWVDEGITHRNCCRRCPQRRVGDLTPDANFSPLQKDSMFPLASIDLPPSNESS